MKTKIGIVLGIVIGLSIIYLPLLIQQAMIPNPMLSGTRDEGDRVSPQAEGVEDIFQRLPVLVAIMGLGVGVAYIVHLLARRQA